MSWVGEFGPYYDVPAFIPFLIRKKILEDMSWHNDVAPSFGVRRETGEQSWEVRLWVDHPFKSHRETGGHRFLVTVWKNDESVSEIETDDLEEALEQLFKDLAQWYLKQETGVLEWRPDSMVFREWEDPAEYLEELKKEYFADERA